MYTRVESDIITLKFDLIKKVHFRVPQNFPSVKKILGFEVNLLKSKHYTLLDIIVIEALVEVVISYMGIDNIVHTMTEEFTLLRSIEKPRGNMVDLEGAVVEIDKDYQVDLPQDQEGEKLRFRKFDVIILIRLFYNLGLKWVKPSGKGRQKTNCRSYSGKGRKYTQTFVSIERNPWKKQFTFHNQVGK